MSFVEAIKNTPSIQSCLRPGLQALRGNSNLINPPDTRKCDGSIDIDSCLANTHSNEARWDYALGYNGKAYFVEVHPANGQVTDVIKKSEWLRGWLKASAPKLIANHADGSFHWLSTGGVNILPKQKLLLAQNKVLVNKLKLG